MPAANFKEQFADMVQAGDKHTTIRARDKNGKCRFKAGDRFVGYTGMRTKKCRPLVDSYCVCAIPISIGKKNDGNGFTGEFYVLLDSNQLTDDAVQRLAHEDGFEDAADFFKFFLPKSRTNFYGDLIIWL